MEEEENKKVRKKAKREYNERVRGLTEFPNKRDKRVILRKKEEEEMRKKKEKERKRERNEMERDKAERARKYEKAEWTRVEDDVEEWEDEQDGEEEEEEEGEQLYCLACGKKFKSKKQWENHEKSKKHKEKVADLRKSFVDDDFREGDEGVSEQGGGVEEIDKEGPGGI